MKKLYVLLVIFTLFLAGCAPLQVNLSNSEYLPIANMTTKSKKVASITVINRAADTALKNNLLSDSFIPIKTAVSTQSTVESDVNLLLAQTLHVDSNADKTILATIRRADAYWTMNLTDKIPFVGLVSSGRDRVFVMHVVMALEIRKNGALVEKYPVDREVKIVGKATTGSAIAESYQRLIAKYRTDVLGDIERDFINKSL